MKYLISDLKSNFTKTEVLTYIEKIKDIKNTNCIHIICPSHPYLPFFEHAEYMLGAQDISVFEIGSHTGEVNGAQLASLGVRYVIVGHSERRRDFKETEEILIQKIKNALKNKMKIIFCIGETKEENQRMKTYVVIEKQLARILNNFSCEEIEQMIIAYEPVWSIGTGVIPSSKTIEEITIFIKKLIKDYYDVNAEVVYGGSVSVNNIEDLKRIKFIDGLMIGGSSLDPDKMAKIANSVN